MGASTKESEQVVPDVDVNELIQMGKPNCRHVSMCMKERDLGVSVLIACMHFRIQVAV